MVGCRKRGTALTIAVWGQRQRHPERPAPAHLRGVFSCSVIRSAIAGTASGWACRSRKRIAHLLGSELSLHSTPGRGSVFAISVGLAIRTSSSRRRSSSRLSGDALAGRCVIVIDDEAAIRQGMHELLSQWGCTCLEAGSAEQALQLLAEAARRARARARRLSLGQGSNGDDAVRLLRAQFGAALPALLITGDTAPERLREAKQSGLHVLHKPVRPAQLRALCNYLLTRRLVLTCNERLHAVVSC